MTRSTILDLIDCSTLDARPPVKLRARNVEDELGDPVRDARPPWAEEARAILRARPGSTALEVALALGMRRKVDRQFRADVRVWLDREVGAGRLAVVPHHCGNVFIRYRLPEVTR
jgi:hypothetical protein